MSKCYTFKMILVKNAYFQIPAPEYYFQTFLFAKVINQ